MPQPVAFMVNASFTRRSVSFDRVGSWLYARSTHIASPLAVMIGGRENDEAAERARRQHLWQWTSRRDFRSGQFAMNDYNHLQPNRRMAAERAGVDSYTRSHLEVYDHPGTYDAPDPASSTPESSSRRSRRSTGGATASAKRFRCFPARWSRCRPSARRREPRLSRGAHAPRVRHPGLPLEHGGRAARRARLDRVAAR